MAIRQIRLWEDEILRKRSKEVEVIDDKIREILDDMVETMHDDRGVGLSAVQVGILKRLVTVDIWYDEEDAEDGKEHKPLKLVNPVIVKQSKATQEVDEGCLSFPNQYAKVIRPKEVTVEALNENGEKITIKAKDLLAQCLCHEIDHLDGVLFVDKMEPGTLQILE